MRRYIKKLQSKPEDIRKQILIGSLAVSMLFVGVIWVYGLGYRFGDDSNIKVRSDIQPFTLFGNSVKDAYSNVSASVGNISFSKDKNSANQ